MNAKYLLIVKPSNGLNIWDTPRPQSQGAVKRRTVGKGTFLHAYEIINFEGVRYAYLVPVDPAKPEWARVAERGSTVNEYLEEVLLEYNLIGYEATILDYMSKLINVLEKISNSLANKR